MCVHQPDDNYTVWLPRRLPRPLFAGTAHVFSPTCTCILHKRSMLVFHSAFSPERRDRPGIKCLSKSFNTVELISMCTQMMWRFSAQLIHLTGQTRKKEALCLSADLNTISRTKTLVWSTGPEVNKVIRITITLSVMDDHYNQFCTVVSWTRMKGNLVYHNQRERSRLTAFQSLPNELKWFQLICLSKYIQKTWQLLFPPLVSA